MGPESWERGCEGWRHRWLMLPISPTRTPTIPSPPPPSHWFCFPLHPPPSQPSFNVHPGWGGAGGGCSGLPPSLGTTFDPPRPGAPALLPTICSGHPRAKHGSASGGEKGNKFPHGSGGHSHSPSPMRVTLPLCRGSFAAPSSWAC